MEPGQVLVFLLYLWLLVALGVYAWRLYRRVVHGETRADRIAARRGEAPPATRPDGAVSAPDPAPRSIADRPTVAELVEGIALPCDLVPVVGDALDPHRVVLATSGHPPTEVAAAMAAELGRLGFAVRSKSETEAVAERGEARLRVRVLPGDDAGRVTAELSS